MEDCLQPTRGQCPASKGWFISGQSRMEDSSKLLEVILLSLRVGSSAVKLGWRTASKLLEVSLLPVRVGTSAVKLGWRTASKLLEVRLLPLRDWHISSQARMEDCLQAIRGQSPACKGLSHQQSS
jgi:hypothetical protein